MWKQIKYNYVREIKSILSKHVLLDMILPKFSYIDTCSPRSIHFKVTSGSRGGAIAQLPLRLLVVVGHLYIAQRGREEKEEFKQRHQKR